MTVSISVDTSGIVDGQNIDAADVTLPISNLKTALEDTLNGIQAFDRINFGAAESLAISAGGAISPTKTHIVVDTFGSAIIDDLDTINGGLQGRWIQIRCASNSRNVILRHGVGNIRTANGLNYTLNSVDVWALLLHNGTNWLAAIMPTNTYLNLGTDTILTIADGTVTRSRTRHLINTESSSDDDELHTINGGSEGDLLIIAGGVNGRVVRVRHNIGNILLANGRDRILRDATSWLWLHCLDNHWVDAMSPPSFPSQTERRFVIAQASGAAPFIEVMGAPVATVTGTASAANQSDSAYTNFIQAAATINTFAGFASTAFNIARRSHNPKFVCILRTGVNVADLQNIRFWIGLSSATVAVTGETLATSFIGFRWSSAAFDPGWIPICSDGGSQSTGGAQGAIDNDTVYKLEFEVNDAANIVTFKVNESYAQVISTNLPASATELGYHCRQITLAAATKNFKVSRLYVETN